MDEDFLRFDKEKEYVFIDCETLNLCLNSCHNLPWQIAMIKAVGNKKIAEKNELNMSIIGEVNNGNGEIMLDGSLTDPKGWDHFDS